MFVFHVLVFMLGVTEGLTTQVTYQFLFEVVLCVAVITKRLERVKCLPTNSAQVLPVNVTRMLTQFFICRKDLAAVTT